MALILIYYLGLILGVKSFTIPYHAGDHAANTSEPSITSKLVLHNLDVKPDLNNGFKKNPGKVSKKIRDLGRRSIDSSDWPLPSPSEISANTSNWGFDKSLQKRSIRSYEQLAREGEEFLNLPVPAQDLSQEGSDIIMDTSNGYYITVGPVDGDIDVPELAGSFTRLLPLYILGKELPPSLNYVDVDNYKQRDSGWPPYEFDIHAAYGLIIVKRAFKNMDLASVKEEKFSELMYRVWYNFAQHTGAAVDGLRYIIHDYVINAETINVTNEIFTKELGGAKYRRLLPWTDEYSGLDGEVASLSASSNNRADLEAFNALVGCPNGKGIARMLRDHSSALRHKRIGNVLVVAEGDNEQEFYHTDRSAEPVVGYGTTYLLYELV
ncbi:hypothetical protein AA313_de0209032 [Arthrobotrys entomopaga]|nr:hypothetical protein AA313_de0209032 [Arthrobotrys entomopaga]